MDIFVLNDNLVRESILDSYFSMIWSERVADIGDFELVVPNTPDMKRLLAVGTRLGINESKRVMICETHDAKQDDEGRDVLTVTGRSLESILAERIAWINSSEGTEAAPKWVINKTPAEAARWIFYQTCVVGALSPSDIIPLYVVGSTYPADTIPESTDVVMFEQEIGTVYERIKEICDQYKLGFRLYKGQDDAKLYFNIYQGSDRTTGQSILDPVVFNPNLDNLAKIQELTSIESLRNVAFVRSKFLSLFVYADGTDSSTSGFARRVITVDASDIELPDRPYTMPQDQIDAIAVALKRDMPTSIKDSLNKLNNKKRLNPDEVSPLNTWTEDQYIGGYLTNAQGFSIQTAINTSVAYNTTEDAYLEPLLTQKGKKELAKNRSLVAFDGEINQINQYVYDVDYSLGDLVEMQSGTGTTNNMRVTEQIFVSDENGSRSYPTLSVDLIITPGSWLAWDANEEWASATGTWSEQ